MLHIYYGFGKGKTSTLNGSAIRAKGADFKVVIYRFLKGVKTSEDEVLEKVGIFVKKLHQGTKFVFQMNGEERLNLQTFIKKELKEIIKIKKEFNFFCFDEIIDLVEVKLITEDELISFLEHFEEYEVLLSGHYELKKLFEKADLITFYEAKKHYFEKGIQARKGIEL
ncbi:cob(I)yrinic acid a,c-diamide adenosyltransferase [[Mycoplasma] mobile]|uniref:Cobalamin adenosyltransferase n=1 Tax=Mycoplasma mobile (strain ATCC 43663 / 163K / NCTC 11711) TaxID=267748 RepID=Q6KIS2_MYCM1|nr:cob(I)yrinic acid a,c-diamide adenosyltransferase [[Mycoplasma] mobile]AAT27503.1 cobalamin adenosyltransferase [Mycoplasma mobile 163K]